MIWAKIRFTLNAEGMYTEYECGFPTEDIPQASMQAAQLCAGYKLGCGLHAFIVQVAGHASTGIRHNLFIMPEQTRDLSNAIDSGRKSLNDSKRSL